MANILQTNLTRTEFGNNLLFYANFWNPILCRRAPKTSIRLTLSRLRLHPRVHHRPHFALQLAVRPSRLNSPTRPILRASPRVAPPRRDLTMIVKSLLARRAADVRVTVAGATAAAAAATPRHAALNSTGRLDRPPDRPSQGLTPSATLTPQNTTSADLSSPTTATKGGSPTTITDVGVGVTTAAAAGAGAAATGVSFKHAGNTQGVGDTMVTPSSSLGSMSKKRAPRLSNAMRRWPQGLACALSIMSSLMVYSVLQERIMTRPYASPLQSALSAGTSWRNASHVHDPLAGVVPARLRRNGRMTNRVNALTDGDDSPAFFQNSLFLVLANRLFAAAVAACCILLRSGRDDLRSKAPLSDYASISLSNVIATSCQYEALKWLTFPTVTIGKCAKMLPVMLILNMRSGRRYSYDDFGIVAVVLTGCAVMISSGNVVAKRSASADSDTPVGFLLLITYLLFDAITSTYQERLFVKYDMSVYNQMIYINVTSATIAIFGLALSGGLRESFLFIGYYPAVLSDITMLSLSAVAGQFAITYTIQSFGALLYAGVMTTRQFFSVLASDIIFKHGLTGVQWAGALMVFSALFFKLWRKARESE